MRIGASILYINGYCYQSYNWHMMRPLGNIQNVVSYLEEYHVDEISIIRPVRSDDTFVSFKQDVEELRNLTSMTPISFGGGIRSIDFLDLVSSLPIEKLVMSTNFIEPNSELIISAIQRFGGQSIQAMLPVCIKENRLFVYHSSISSFVPYTDLDINFISTYANEIIIYDLMNEGLQDRFNKTILEYVDFPIHKIILSGGMGVRSIKAAKQASCAAVHIENRVLHQEYSMARYKYVCKL